jgi:hypothetical protein
LSSTRLGKEELDRRVRCFPVADVGRSGCFNESLRLLDIDGKRNRFMMFERVESGWGLL